MPRYFSLEEANLTLEEIRPLVGEIISIHNKILERQPEAWPAIEHAAGNGGSRAARYDFLVKSVGSLFI